MVEVSLTRGCDTPPMEYPSAQLLYQHKNQIANLFTRLPRYDRNDKAIQLIIKFNKAHNNIHQKTR